MNTEYNAELKRTDEGLSLSLYAHQDGEVTLVDEWWGDIDELDSTISLNTWE